jgi:hypothetical protein
MLRHSGAGAGGSYAHYHNSRSLNNRDLSESIVDYVSDHEKEN